MHHAIEIIKENRQIRAELLALKLLIEPRHPVPISYWKWVRKLDRFVWKLDVGEGAAMKLWRMEKRCVTSGILICSLFSVSFAAVPENIPTQITNDSEIADRFRETSVKKIKKSDLLKTFESDVDYLSSLERKFAEDLPLIMKNRKARGERSKRAVFGRRRSASVKNNAFQSRNGLDQVPELKSISSRIEKSKYRPTRAKRKVSDKSSS